MARAPADPAGGPPRISPPARASKATNSTLAAGRSVHRRVALPSEPGEIEETVRALREQQRLDHKAIVQLNENVTEFSLMMAEQAEVVEAQRKWNEDNARRVLAMEGAIAAATVEANHCAKEKCDELKATLEDYIPKAMDGVEEKLNQRLGTIEKFFEFLRKAKPG